MDKNEFNVSKNAGESQNTKRELNDIPEELKSLAQEIKEGAKEGQKKALDTPISKENIEDLKEALAETPDDLIGKDLDDLLQHVADVVEKHPSELVLVKLLWVLTILGSPQSLGGFGKSLTMLAMIKSIRG